MIATEPSGVGDADLQGRGIALGAFQRLGNLRTRLRSTRNSWSGSASIERERSIALIQVIEASARSLKAVCPKRRTSVSELTGYNALEQELLQQQLAQVSALQTQATNDLSQLFQLHQAQQAVLTTLTTQVDFLTSQVQAPQAELAALEAKLSALKE